MVATIARKEFRETIRDGRFRLSFLILASLLAVALLFGWQARRLLGAERSAAQSEDVRVWRSQGPRNPHSAGHFGRYVFKPTSPLAFLDTGLTSYLGVAAHIEAHAQTPARHRPAEDAGELARFGELTAAGVLQVLVPLVIILLAFGAFAGEREQGTLRQLLSLGVRRRDLALGKAAGLSLAWLALLVPVTLAGSLVLLASGPEGTASLPRLGWMTLAYLLYFGSFLGVSLAVSALARSSRTALVTLLGFWVLNCLLVPRLATDAAERLHPAPATQTFFAQVTAALKNGLDGHDPADQRMTELKTRVLAQYKAAKVEDLPVNFDAIAMQEGEEHGNAVLDQLYGRLWTQYDRQAATQRAFSAIAPLLALRPFSAAMAGTDLNTHRAFTANAEQYRRGFIRLLNHYQRDHSKTGDWDWKADPAFWATAPDFDFAPPKLQEQMPSELPSLAILAMWCLGALTLAVIAAGRTSVMEGA